MSEILRFLETSCQAGIPATASVLIIVILLLFTFMDKRAKNREKLLEETFRKTLEMEAKTSASLRETILVTMQREEEILRSIKQLLKDISASNRELKGALLLLQADISEVKGMILKNEIQRR